MRLAVPSGPGVARLQTSAFHREVPVADLSNWG